MSAKANSGRVLCQLARADFLERVRRYSYLVTLGLTAYLGYLAATGKLTLRLGDMRGTFNSAWIGALMSLVVTTFLSLAGFYVVKNTIERDRQTRVGQILASTPISKFLYVLGKCVSNFAVLATMVLMLAIAGMAMQLLRGEDTDLQVWKLLAPMLLLALPAMAVVGSLAVLFETVSWLRGGFGNVVYFFVWVVSLSVPVSSGAQGRVSPLDWPGISLIWRSMAAVAGDSGNGFSLSISDVRPMEKGTFVWNGVDWNSAMVTGRLAWFAVALVIAVIAALLFDRFDSAAQRAPRRSANEAPATDAAELPGAVVGGYRPSVPLPKWSPTTANFRFGAMFVAELRLMLKGQKWWWYAGALLLMGLSLFLPTAEARGVALGVAWVWPVLLWSAMGVREKRDQTEQLLFSAPHPIARQLVAVWSAGFVLAVITGVGFGLRLLAAGELRGFFAWFVGALFIPTLALALGVWSGTSKPFEIVFMLLWYLGPMHAMVPLDFMGSSPATAATRVPLYYLCFAAALAVAALAGRKKQLEN